MRIAHFLLIGAMLLLAFGCGKETPVVTEPIVIDEPVVTQPEKEILIGILPLQNPTEMLARFGPTEEYLRETTGLNIRMRYYPTEGAVGGYTQVVKDLVEGNVQLAYLSPTTIAQAYVVSDGVAFPFACAVNEGAPTYTGEIAVRVNSTYQTIYDLEGKPVAGTSASSTSGNLMPTAYLNSLGIKKETFFQFEFLGAHDKAAGAVVNGQMEAAFINEATYNKFNKEKTLLKSVYTHPPVPEFPFCVNKNAISEADFATIRDALLVQHETEKGLAAIVASTPKYSKWVPIQWENYTTVKEACDSEYGDIFYDLENWVG